MRRRTSRRAPRTRATLRPGDAALASEYFERAVNLGMPTMNDLYRQEAFEAWTHVGRHDRTLSATGRALRTFSRSKELQYVRALASKALGPARGYGWRPQPSPDLYRNFIKLIPCGGCGVPCS